MYLRSGREQEQSTPLYDPTDEGKVFISFQGFEWLRSKVQRVWIVHQPATKRRSKCMFKVSPLFCLSSEKTLISNI